MRRTAPPLCVLALVAAGCAPTLRGLPAPPDALECATHVLAAHGYHVIRVPEHFPSALRAERQLPPEGFYPVFGEVEVTLFGSETGERRMRVSGRRYEVVQGTGAGVHPVLDPIRPSPGVQDPQPTAPVRARRRSLSPGPVAEHVATVRARCALREPPHAEPQTALLTVR